MDRVQFLNSMNKNNITNVDIITKYFNEYIYVYDIVNDIDSCNVTENDNIISFTFVTKDSANIDQVVNTLSSNPIVMIYDKTYITSIFTIDSNTFEITLQENRV